MKIFIAGLITETNTFSPIPTGYANYKETALYHGDATAHASSWASGILHRWKELGTRDGATVVESLFAMAQPAGPTVESVYSAFVTEILDDLKAAGPVDMVLLSLHGAMVVTNVDDPEGQLLEKIREIVGPNIPLGIELDSHGHFSDRMQEHASLAIVYKEYPHTDMGDRAEELYSLCSQMAAGTIKPHLSVHDCRMIGIWPTSYEPMRSFVTKMESLEGQGNVLSVSFLHSFPWADVPHMGAKTLVITNDDAKEGDRLTAKLAEDIWAIRHKTGIKHHTIEKAMAHAKAATAHPIVLADVADNPGGGAAGDSSFLLDAALKARLERVLFSSIWDPVAVELCKASGVGARLSIRLGGKCGAASGTPLDLDVKVEAIKENATQTLSGLTIQMGDCIRLSCGPVDILVNSIRTQTLSPNILEQVGVTASDYETIIVKSMHHFHAGFAPIAADILYVSSPGALSLDFANIPYENVTAPRWPVVKDPFSTLTERRLA